MELLDPGDRPAAGLGSWIVRRRFMFLVTGFCIGVVVYSLGFDLRSRVAETAVTMSFVTIIGVVGSYVFGAAWQDVSAIRAGHGGGGSYTGYEEREWSRSTRRRVDDPDEEGA